MRRKEVNMLEGSILKGLFAIALPIMLMNVIQSLFNVVDMTVLKSFDTGDGYAVGAVGSCGMLISLVTGLVIGISAGSNVVVAKYIGRGEKERTERAVGASVFVSLVGGFLLLAVGVSCARLFLAWTNCPAQLLDGATLYFRLYFAGAPILALYSFAAAILRAAGDSKSPMIYLILGGVAKLAFNLLFVGAFSMGVRGTAYATLISWAVTALLSMWTLLRFRGTVRLKLGRIRPYGAELKEILLVGVPAGLQQGLYSIANVVITSTVNTFGADAATGISIANQFDNILYQISVAPSLAVMPYVSQNVARGNVKRASRAVSRGMLITVALGATFGAVSAIFSPQLSSLMSDSAAEINYSCQKMTIISSTYFICGINEIMGAALRGMGKPIVPAVATLVYMCLFRFVWVYLIFPLCPNLTFLYLVWPIGWVLSIATLLLFFFPTLRKHRELAAQIQIA